MCTLMLFHTLSSSLPGSDGKESACDAGGPGSIPGSGRSAGEGKGDPLQDSSASLVAQLVKNPPAMQETWVQSLGLEDPLEKAMATHCSILAWRIPWGRKELDATNTITSLSIRIHDLSHSVPLSVTEKFHLLLSCDGRFSLSTSQSNAEFILKVNSF